MDVAIRPIALDDVVAASLVIHGESMEPEGEHERDVDAYRLAVEETRRRRGEVLVAEVDGEVVGVCQVLIFPHFQHTGGWCCELESIHVRSDRRGQWLPLEPPRLQEDPVGVTVVAPRELDHRRGRILRFR